MPETKSLMHESPHRTVRLNDGTREIQKWIGADRTLRGSDNDANWEPVAQLKDDEVIGGFVRIVTDIEIAPHPNGTGLILKTPLGILALTTEIVEALHAALPDHVAAAKGIKAVRDVLDEGRVRIGPDGDFATLQEAIAAGLDAVQQFADAAKAATEKAEAAKAIEEGLDAPETP